MAKLKAPLLSLGAAGAIGKALVFFPWKGLDVVREYVIPSNPQTVKQTTQRGYLTDAVAAVHAAQADATDPLNEEDIIAYSALGNTRKTPRTWFNEIIKLWCDVKVAGDVPVIYRDINWNNLAPATFTVILRIDEETGSQLAAGKFYFGTSPTSLFNSQAATVNAAVDVRIDTQDLSAFLTAGTKYYMQFKPDSGDPCEGANSGIYNFVAE